MSNLRKHDFLDEKGPTQYINSDFFWSWLDQSFCNMFCMFRLYTYIMVLGIKNKKHENLTRTIKLKNSSRFLRVTSARKTDSESSVPRPLRYASFTLHRDNFQSASCVYRDTRKAQLAWVPGLQKHAPRFTNSSLTGIVKNMRDNAFRPPFAQQRFLTLLPGRYG